MDVTDLTPQLETLEANLDELEEALLPLLQDMREASSRLPLLDKAKLNVLSTYALESLLFCSLRLNGVDAKSHAIFQELARVRQYFEKVKKIEEPPTKPATSLDTQAAIRFVRADLADNAQIKEDLTEMLAKERAKSEAKAAVAAEKKRRAELVAEDAASAEKGNGAQEATPRKKPKHRKSSKPAQADTQQGAG